MRRRPAVIRVVTGPFDRRLVLLHRFTCFWASLYTWCNPAWQVTVEGCDKIRPGTTYVMVANHLSLIDILVLFRLFRHFKWVSKIENFKVPFIGWNMRLNRYIELRRGDAYLEAIGKHHGIDFVKIDVEGAELRVLEGLEQYTSKYRPTYFIEVDNKNAAGFQEWLTTANYRVVDQYHRYSVNINYLVAPT